MNEVSQREVKVPPKGTSAQATKVDAFGWTIVDEPGVLFNIDKRDLLVDTQYQREVNKDRVRSIARSWSWVGCGVIVVGERDRRYFVIDGQHRVEAARIRADITELPCVVFRTDGPKTEAGAFVRANTERKPMSVFDRARAKLVAGDEITQGAYDLVAKYGYAFNRIEGPYTIRCIARFMDAYKNEPETLERMWPVIVAAHHGANIKEVVFTALIYVERFGSQSLTSDYWRNRIIAIGSNALHEAAVRAARAFARGGAKVWAFGVLQELNKRINTARQITLKDNEA